MTATLLPDKVYEVEAQISAVSRQATLLHRFRKLLDRLRPEDAFDDHDKIAVKLHVGGADSYTTVHPQFVRAVVERFAGRSTFLYVVDDSPYFQVIKVAGMVAHADGLIVISHAKGHASCGLGAAIKNIGIGCVAQETRNHIHTFEGHDNWRQEVLAQAPLPHEALADGVASGRFFSHALARSAHEVRSFDPAKVLCLDVALNVHQYCDCWGLSSPAFIPDVGLFLGNDPADVDEAVLNAVAGAPFVHGSLPGFLTPLPAEQTESGHLLERMHGKNPWLAVAEFRRLRAAQHRDPTEG